MLGLLDGHPLALTWAAALLARGDEDPQRLLSDWTVAHLPPLNDPPRAENTREWLFARSVRSLPPSVTQVLAAAGLLARAPFPLALMSPVAEWASAQTFAAADDVARAALRWLMQRGFLRRTSEEDHWTFDHFLSHKFARQLGEVAGDEGLRERVGASVCAYAQASDGTSASDAVEHVVAVLAADTAHVLWEVLGAPARYDLTERHLARGRLDRVHALLRGAQAWLGSLPTRDTSAWARHRAMYSLRSGELREEQGDLTGAGTAYAAALAIAERLAAADSTNATWQRDLSVSHSKLGELREAQGDRVGAETAFASALSIRERLAKADPTNAMWQQDVRVSRDIVARATNARRSRCKLSLRSPNSRSSPRR